MQDREESEDKIEKGLRKKMGGDFAEKVKNKSFVDEGSIHLNDILESRSSTEVIICRAGFESCTTKRCGRSSGPQRSEPNPDSDSKTHHQFDKS